MAKQTFTVGQVLTAAQMTSLQQTAMGGGSTTAKTASYTLVAADAGTVVQMNSASATTITVNQSLFAAGDTVQIQNVGVGVCTVTAGTATVSTSSTLALKQYDAGSLYFNTTSAAIFFASDAADGSSPLTTKGDLYGFSTLDARIPIGTNNQVLTADSAQALGLKWATPTTAAFIGCSVTKSAVQSIANATATTLTWDGELFDTSTFHDNSTNNSRITIPAGKDGYYQVTAFASPTGNATGIREITVAKNAGLTSLFDSTLNTGTATSIGFGVSGICSLVATDFLQVQVYQNSGGSLNYNYQSFITYFSVTYLGA